MAVYSGIARVLCAMGQKIFCAPINKTAESEMKNRRKRKTSADFPFALFYFYFFVEHKDQHKTILNTSKQGRNQGRGYKNTRLIFAQNLRTIKNNPSLSKRTKSQILSSKCCTISKVHFASRFGTYNC